MRLARLFIATAIAQPVPYIADVTAFGARGDGVTRDEAAIMAAVAAVAAHSGGVLRAVGLEVGEPRSAVLLWAKGAPGAGACSGDSGGPIFNARGEVTALVAWTRGAAGRLCGALTQGPWLAPLRRWIDQD